MSYELQIIVPFLAIASGLTLFVAVVVMFTSEPLRVRRGFLFTSGKSIIAL